jgi:3',5'-cyclic AMP phosphodiesterase CpdA
MTPAETLILRFRDLVTSKGGTIKEHQEVIKTKGHVFWGWWNKLGEQPPASAFEHLSDRASTTGLDVYLFDSGQNVVHRARCVRIHWAPPTVASMVTPDQAATPAYYKDQTYPAWFEFANIETLPRDPWPLSSLSYARVDELFSDGTSRFTQFYEKRIASAQELAQQNRTIWFVRSARSDDSAAELLLTKASPPDPFLRRLIDSSSANLLWISDTHFSVDGHHAFPTDSKVNPTLGITIENALKDHDVRSLAGVMHTGDLTWKADPAEFREAARFLSWLRTTVPFDDTDPFSLCPGNHDLAFSIDPSKKEAVVDAAPPKATAAYRAFYKDFFRADSNEYLSSGRRYLLAGALPVEVATLNSSLLQQSPNWFQGHGFVGEGQLRDAADRMGWTARDELRSYRILMLHHHLMPATYRDDAIGGHIYSVALDAEAIVQWVVKHRVDLVLHGHMHEPFCARVSRPRELNSNTTEWHTFHVAGMGSTGVERAHVGPVGVNTFGVLRFRAAGPRLAVYSVSPKDKSKLLWEVSLAKGGDL